MQNILSGFNQSMAQGFYKLFWDTCGTKGLTLDQKIEALVKLKDLSLKTPYWQMNETEKHEGKTLSERFPELIPANLCTQHQHLSKLSGLLLYTMHTEIFAEIKQLAENGQLTTEQIKKVQE